MPKEPIRMVIMAGAFAAMLLISVFTWKVSSVVLLLTAAAVSLAVFLVRKLPEGKEGDRP
jgi:chromate transporter